MRKSNVQTVAVITILLLAQAVASADSVRGPVAKIIRIDGLMDQSDMEFRLGLEDLAGFSVTGRGALFLEGLEIAITVPEPAQKYRDGFALYFYRSVSPFPDSDIRGYRGSEAGFIIVPATDTMYVQIPVVSNHTMSSSFDSPVLDTILLERDSPILLTILPVMKGLPTSVVRSSFNVVVTPKYQDKGLIALSISAPKLFDPGSARVFIDDVELAADPAGYIVPSGFHDLRVFVPGFEEFRKRIGVTSGTETPLPVVLVPRKSTVTVSAPAGTEVVLDGKALTTLNQPIEIEPGDHVAVFKLGGHSVSKKFSLNSGERVSVSLLLDITVDYE